MSSCGSDSKSHSNSKPSCSHSDESVDSTCHSTDSFDWLLWGSLAVVSVGYVLFLFQPDFVMAQDSLMRFSHSSFELMNKMWWGIVLAIFFVGLLEKIPREFVMATLGTQNGLQGLFRATLAGLVLDLCSHGILVVGMKLYERGASLGQVMAFLIASPWNSLSLTIILAALIGWKWTLAFVLLSALVALFTGWVFDRLVAARKLPGNPMVHELDEGFELIPEARRRLKTVRYNREFFASLLKDGLSDSKMVLRWIFFGVVLASVLHAFLKPEDWGVFFGPSLAGLGLTLVVATVLEVCSEGSAPLAAELVNTAKAPGNGFVFLMTGVATDYTEIMAIKETTRSWKISLFLPLITVPQVLLIGYWLNGG